MTELFDQLTDLSRVAAKAIAAVVAPLVVTFIADVTNLLAGSAQNWAALVAGAITVYLVPNKN